MRLEEIHDINFKSLPAVHQIFFERLRQILRRQKAGGSKANIPALSATEIFQFLVLPVKYFEKVTANTENMNKDEFTKHIKNVLSLEARYKNGSLAIGLSFTAASIVGCREAGWYLGQTWQSASIGSICGIFMGAAIAVALYQPVKNTMRNLSPVPLIDSRPQP